ncbi:tetratricopeptide repeat protein 31 [Tiliqua scincoides]|uniref:tetratricopeptide repeat protein 31 n=1 Tax=Tiliqua scincoides TaxID=71010 RepID=UPI003461EA0B
MWMQRLLVAERGDDEDEDEACPDGEPRWACPDRDDEDEDGLDAGGGPATFCGFRRAFLCPAPASSAPGCPLRGFALPREQPPPRPTAEEAARNAEELLAEEERLRRRAEKKRLKKRRRKDRRRQERRQQQQQPAESGAEASIPGKEPLIGTAGRGEPGLPDWEGSSAQDPSESPASSGRSTEEETEEELDLTSTFVSKARLKVGPKPLLPPSLRKGKAPSPVGKELEPKVEQEVPRSCGLQMNPVEQSLVLADCGNETAKRECYREAVLLFTEAVKLNPREYRFFGNRSFCYEKLQCYVEALRDAQLALSLQPGWPKGLFRQGKALMGLKRYAEAARTFKELLQLDGSRHDAAIQLERCRAQLLLENGFSQYHLKWNVPAREGQLPLPGAQPRDQPLTSSTSQSGRHLAPVTITNSKRRTLPPPVAQAPIREWFAVWVGNLMPQITQEDLRRYFQPFGPIDSIRRLPRKFCAFVNYTSKEAAEAAFTALQGVEVEGSKLLLQLKHPVHATPLPTKASSGL